MGVFSFDFHPMMLGMYLPYRAADQPLRPDPDGTSAFHCSPLDVGFLCFLHLGFHSLAIGPYILPCNQRGTFSCARLESSLVPLVEGMVYIIASELKGCNGSR